MIKFWIEDNAGNQRLLETPAGESLSLMEILVAVGFPIDATCGGIALCATCLVQVLTERNTLPEPNENELLMLDTLPIPAGNYRLACQLRISDSFNGCKFKLV
ncbi:2Fe-2S iron-sulfur cluster-binding protein [Mucilaginibacter sp. HD30]